MAYLPTPDDDEAQRRAALAGPAPAAPVPTGPPVQATQAPAGSGFVNLQRYLGANASGGAAMTERLAGGVERGAADTRAAGDRLAGDTIQAAQRQWGSPQGYQGPEAVDAAGFDALRGRVDTGARQAALLGSTAGVSTALGQAYGARGGYGTGARGLDAALAGAGAGGQRLQRASKAYDGLRDYLGASQTQAQGAIDVARRTANAARDAAPPPAPGPADAEEVPRRKRGQGYGAPGRREGGYP